LFSGNGIRAISFLVAGSDGGASLNAETEDGDKAEQHAAKTERGGAEFFLLISVITH
jgi:hypothetical protein